eukprot:1471601-Alexandrium_andersonii.AAC.1
MCPTARTVSLTWARGPSSPAGRPMLRGRAGPGMPSLRSRHWSALPRASPTCLREVSARLLVRSPRRACRHGPWALLRGSGPWLSVRSPRRANH